MAKKRKSTPPVRQMTRRQLSRYQKQKRRQRFTLFGGIGIISAIVIIILLGWLLADFLPWQETMVKVNDREFNMRYFVDFLKGTANYNQDTGSFQVFANNAATRLTNNELITQAALRDFGISVSDEEAGQFLTETGLESPNQAYIDLVKYQLLTEKLKDEQFGTIVPVSDTQVHALIMMVESERKAREIRELLVAGGNFTALADEFALNYYSQNVNSGDFGWHPREIYKDQLEDDVPIDYAFTAEIGSLSQPMYSDKQKQLGYWLLRVNHRDGDVTANITTSNVTADVSGLLLPSLEEAEIIRERLLAGDDLATLAEEYSDYSTSREKGGEIGEVVRSHTEGKTAISQVFDDYVFGVDTVLGEWSQPIQDDQYWTEGGYWLVQILGRENDRELSEEDRSFLIDNLYNKWTATVTADTTGVTTAALTDERKQWATQRAMEELKSQLR